VGALETLQSRLKIDVPVKHLENLQDAASMSLHVETVLDQVRHLRASVEHSLEHTKQKPRTSKAEPPENLGKNRIVIIKQLTEFESRSDNNIFIVLR